MATRGRGARTGARPVAVSGPTIGLSTSSVYPEGCAAAFELAARLGYDGVEVMVWTDPLTREAGALRALAELHGIRILSIHAPTLLVTQRVWGNDPWVKIDRSIELAAEVGADTVVLHPPFRWQREYAAGFIDGVALREHDTGMRLAVENMYPRRGARAGGGGGDPPDWGAGPAAGDHVTLDLSHTATAGSDAVGMVHDLGPRLAHLHLADGVGSPRDEHLVPGRGTQPCGEVLELLAESGFGGHVVVEVGTRRASAAQRELDLAESLAFARLHLAT